MVVVGAVVVEVVEVCCAIYYRRFLIIHSSLEVEATAKTEGTILHTSTSLSRKPTVIHKMLSATYHVLSMST
jgi:hypothetical protein